MKKTVYIFVFVIVFVSGCCEHKDSTGLYRSNDELIAFSGLTDGYWQIWVVSSDGTALEQITDSPSDKRYPIWNADGTKLYYRTGNNKIFKVDIISKKETPVLTEMWFVGGVYPCPVDDRLLFVRYDSTLKDSANLWLVDGSGDKTMVTREAGIEFEPCWSADGRYIAYVNSHGYSTAELYLIRPDGSGKKRLTHNTFRETCPDFASDGGSIIYASEETGDYEIWKMDLQTKKRSRLTDSVGLDTRPYYSPDGKSIVFASNRSGNLRLWIMNADGTNPNMIPTNFDSMDPAWRYK